MELLLIAIWTNVSISSVIFVIVVCDFARKFLSNRHLPNVKSKFSKAFFTLLPLLGVQYSILALLKSNRITQILSVVFTASHGLVVAVLVCFLSEELGAAIKRWICSRQFNNPRQNIPPGERQISSRDEETLIAQQSI
ncbi:Oidioi.mRNA.OKI2018_I69.XSR.g16116.t1.cds [Oikopleura dioica]|uniref:Oidioi.mRNA.OKI2018_I69.XSR.g16116.t1.cds n=1 Tax=Oikopleura dioica TaxID=34765 RepID=A0ABN7SK61_OIKDI|nr:Oidioi.mRNA.OKI2018_I69.XSR.g16116.t1.cds [Oikopleura dioica]